MAIPWGEIVLEEMAARCVSPSMVCMQKIQMWLSAKWVSAHLHKYSQTNSEMGAETYKRSGTVIVKVFNPNIPLV